MTVYLLKRVYKAGDSEKFKTTLKIQSGSEDGNPAAKLEVDDPRIGDGQRGEGGRPRPCSRMKVEKSHRELRRPGEGVAWFRPRRP